METRDVYEEFLEAVEALRAGQTVVRATAHTSNVTTDGWPPEAPESSGAR